jgi:hypothetical protein
MARGPSYTDDERSTLDRLARNKMLTLDEKVAEFQSLHDGRTADAVGQKLRKLSAKVNAAGEKKRGRPPKPSPVAAATAAKTNGNGNGNGHHASAKKVESAPAVLTVDLNGVTLTGAPQKVGQLLSQLSAA